MSYNNSLSKVSPVKKLAFCSICIALAAVASMIKLYSFPFGGSVTMFSMLIIVLPSWFYGVRTGALSGVVFGLIQFAVSPYIVSVPQFILDYILAFSIMCVAGLFCNRKNGLLIGYAVAVFARWVIATLAGLSWVAAGFMAWENWDPLPYSMAYNAAYIFAEAAATIIIICIPAMKKALERVKKMSQE